MYNWNTVKAIYIDSFYYIMEKIISQMIESLRKFYI